MVPGIAEHAGVDLARLAMWRELAAVATGRGVLGSGVASVAATGLIAALLLL